MHERISVNALCFGAAGLSEVASHWRELGPRRVSFKSAQLVEDPSRARSILEAGDYELETVTHLFWEGRAADPTQETWDAERAKLSRLIDVVAALGGRSVNMMTGGHGDLAWEEAAESFCSAVAPCVARANAAGVTLTVESTNPLYADMHLAHSLRDAVTLADRAGIGICIDLFWSWADGGLKQTIEAAMPRLALIQIADYAYGDRSVPSRAVPGDGSVPLRRILEWALSAGYAGAFDLELIGPRIDAEGHLAATRRAAGHLGELLRSLGA